LNCQGLPENGSNMDDSFCVWAGTDSNRCHGTEILPMIE
jgi:hypothetical protein